jgi:acetolactate synthase-1/3 small subunit
MVEISGQERKIEAFIESVRQYEILELARTGRIALVRGNHKENDADDLTSQPGTVLADAEDDEPMLQGHSEL